MTDNATPATDITAADPQASVADAKAEKAAEPVNWWHEIRSLLLLIFGVLCIHSFLAKPFYIPSISMMPTMLVGDQLVVSKYAYGWSYASPSFDVLPKMKGRIWGSYPARGDVVIIDHPVTGDEYIKRVIGLPGDQISIKDGALTINGVAVKKEQMPDLELINDPNSHCSDYPLRMTQNAAGTEICSLPIIRETLPNGVRYSTIDDGVQPLDNILNPATGANEITIPAGHVFLMGDNRDHSADSRATFDQKGLGGPVPIENIGGRAEFITFSMDGHTKWYNPISWFSSMRDGRAGTTLRPETPAK
jgi:signal peptidase I